MNRVEVLRVLRRLYEARRFSASVIASIAIGVAPIFVAFSLFEAAVLRDMAVKTPDQLLAIQSARNARGKSRTVTRGISFPDYQDVRTALPRDSWKYMTAWKVLDVTASVSGGYQPLRVAVISGDYFPIASARFLRGRAPDDQGGVVVTHGLWRRLAVGSDTTELTIYGQRYRITGVIAAPFRGIYPDEGVDAWIPLGTLPRLNGDLALLTYRELDDLFVVVQPAAQREADVFGPSVAALSRRLSEFHGGGQFGWRLDVTRAQPGIVEHLRTTRGQTALAPVLVLLCVLLIAATNVANLFVVRSAARENEHQVRLALGISRRHLLLLEGLDPLVLGVLGLALGLWLGILGLRYVADLRALARWDLRVTGISVLIACGAALLFASICALMPAMRVRRLRAVDIIHRGYGITSRGVSRLQRSYLIVQFTFALGFTCVAIQLASAVRQQSAVDVGFDTKNLYVITGTTGASSRTADQYLSDFNRVTSAVSTIPGVLAVSASVSEFFVGYRMTARPVSTTPVNARGA
ncbi:MAG: ABC transporter permease, partial [Nocardioidaceae bacterium]